MKVSGIEKSTGWLLSPVVFLLSVQSVFATEEPQVRVAILQEAPEARITVLAPCRLIDLATGAVIEERPSLKWQLVKPGNPGIQIGPREIPSSTVVVEPKGDTIVRANARPYRGSFILMRTQQGNLTVINRISLEEYLVSALASEAASDWPIESLKAHAVVSRTLVAHRIWISREKPFDMTADTRTHLYYGVNAERRRTRLAVEKTRGQVLVYHNELISSTFHANCGGHTEDASELWSTKEEIAPLRGHPDPYCRGLRHFSWRMDLPSEELAEILEKAGEKLGTLQACEAVDRNRSGRVKLIRIRGSRGTVALSGRRFRELLGANRLRSLKFTVSVAKGKVFFQGYGWGHGVGFCQWGAYGMARKGKSMDEILALYFPETERRKLDGLPGFN